jgi:hemoglobin/transferrin/lactoferrin receptor protein
MQYRVGSSACAWNNSTAPGQFGRTLGLTMAALIFLSPGHPALAQDSAGKADDLPEVVVETPSATTPGNSGASKKKSQAKAKKSASQPAPVASGPSDDDFDDGPAVTPGDNTSNDGPLSKGNDVTISQSEINRTQPQSVQGLFAGESAVSAGGSTSASYKVYVHGVEETFLNVQIDGARQSQRGAFHHNSNNLIDPSMLKGVAIDAGAAGADAGPHSLGGAIRYTTKDARDFLSPGQPMGGFVSLSYDSNAHTFKKSASAYGMSNGFEILGYASWADGDAYEDGRGNTIVATDVDLVNYLGKLAYEGSSGDRIAFSAEYITDEGIRPFRSNLALIPGANNLDYSYNESKRETYTLKYTTTKPSSLYDPEVSFYYNKSSLFRPPIDPPQRAAIPGPPIVCTPGETRFFCVGFGDVEIESIGGKVQNTFTIGPGKLTTGVDYYRDKSSVDHFGGTAILSEEVRNFGGYAQYRFSPIDPLRISTGVRVDRNEQKGADGTEREDTGASPNVSAEFDLTRQLMAKASYGYSFGGTPLYEAILMRSTGIPAFPTVPGYSADLEPQKSRQYKLGLAFKQSGFAAEGSYFDTRIIDPVCPNCSGVGAGGAALVINEPDVVTKGYDLSASYTWRAAKLAVNFSHIETEFDDTAISPLQYYYGTPVGDLLKISGYYKFEGTGVTIGFLSQFAFDYDDSADIPVQAGGTVGVLEGYDVHNVYAQWQPNAIKGLTLRADIFNLFDEFYVDRATAFGGAQEPLAAAGRTVMVTGKMQF